jgi:hypothetical protein
LDSKPIIILRKTTNEDGAFLLYHTIARPDNISLLRGSERIPGLFMNSDAESTVRAIMTSIFTASVLAVIEGDSVVQRAPDKL